MKTVYSVDLGEEPRTIACAGFEEPGHGVLLLDGEDEESGSVSHEHSVAIEPGFAIEPG